jgi:hypothetical protein
MSPGACASISARRRCARSRGKPPSFYGRAFGVLRFLAILAGGVAVPDVRTQPYGGGSGANAGGATTPGAW